MLDQVDVATADGDEGVKSSNQAAAGNGSGNGRGRARSKDSGTFGLFPVYVIKLSTADPYQPQTDMDQLLAGKSSGKSSQSPPPLDGGSEEIMLIGGHTAKV